MNETDGSLIGELELEPVTSSTLLDKDTEGESKKVTARFYSCRESKICDCRLFPTAWSLDCKSARSFACAYTKLHRLRKAAAWFSYRLLLRSGRVQAVFPLPVVPKLPLRDPPPGWVCGEWNEAVLAWVGALE